ncbi:MAG: hypothetical protein GTO45_07520 [Candidatus Aminicenantes bacterium]|nr:hypothetical protein [Candidatus Aminicenantes bacterium]NIN17932.1 hypothetical protein [Candidatus Aminicenantes bacterium]NIN41835.1 hypothetical protein [Candidatus Aminicenantes bacterium]NIN84587.1 hypothetical protein [Candidatus Aminicenantes bacterium]NIO80744.1 hypothetical protein [Candidatus Aminicenantes bacterium]
MILLEDIIWKIGFKFISTKQLIEVESLRQRNQGPIRIGPQDDNGSEGYGRVKNSKLRR